jgi:hypothetical protein
VGQSNMMRQTDYYRFQLEDAQIYQDWVMIELGKRGIIIQVFGSKEFQYKIGETPSGDEIKFDKRQLKTGNLAIETHEKTNSANNFFVASGINRPNITTWYHGNYENLWIFNFRELRKYVFDGLHRRLQPLREYKTETSMGILLPCFEADHLCLKKIRFNEKDLIKSVEIMRPVEVPYCTNQPRKERSLFTFQIGVQQ